MKCYSIHIPSWVYAMTCYGTSRQDAIARFRVQHGLNRMPKGFAIWEA
jgi:hypothetical protein